MYTSLVRNLGKSVRDKENFSVWNKKLTSLARSSAGVARLLKSLAIFNYFECSQDRNFVIYMSLAKNLGGRGKRKF
jgi:hypothetical protein